MSLPGPSPDDVAVIKLTPQALNDVTAEVEGERLLRLADEQARRKLLLDLGDVPYLTSMWLGKLIALHKRVQGRGGHLALVNVPARVYEVFQVTSLNTVLDVRPKAAG
jgi:anti-anti-sigma factor